MTLDDEDIGQTGRLGTVGRLITVLIARVSLGQKLGRPYADNFLSSWKWSVNVWILKFMEGVRLRGNDNERCRSVSRFKASSLPNTKILKGY